MCGSGTVFYWLLLDEWFCFLCWQPILICFVVKQHTWRYVPLASCSHFVSNASSIENCMRLWKKDDFSINVPSLFKKLSCWNQFGFSGNLKVCRKHRWSSDDVTIWHQDEGKLFSSLFHWNDLDRLADIQGDQKVCCLFVYQMQ